MTATIITLAASARLTSLENVCLDLGLEIGSTRDRQIDRFIDTVSGRVATLCNRAFGRQIYRERIYSIPCEGVVLDAGPQVNRIISVWIQGGAAYDPRDYMLSNGKLLLSGPSNGAIGDGSAYNLWHSLRPSLVVEYEAGWLLPDEKVGTDFTGDTLLPADVESAVIQLVGVAVSEAGRDFTVKQESVEGIGSKTFYVQGSNAMLPHPGAEAALMPYRRLVLV